jgi:hypothetical protein
MDGSYSLKLSEKNSLTLLPVIYPSNLKVVTDNGDASAANSFAIDVAGFYQSEEILPNSMEDGEQSCIQNLGRKSVMIMTK